MSAEKFTWPEVGRILSGLRAQRQLSLTQVQELTGLSRPTLVSAEKGNDIQLSTLHSLLSAYGVDPKKAFSRDLLPK